MATHTIIRAVNDGAEQLTKSTQVTAGMAIELEETISADAADLEIALAFDEAKLQSIYLLADQDLTIDTNSSSVPQETISLLANVPFLWTAADAYFANPFAGPVTSIFVTCGEVGTILKGRLIVDPT